ncbi:MAG: hypothetical protein WC249_00840 [Patescibacteria group bacterium]|jgi:hypothetical protein
MFREKYINLIIVSLLALVFFIATASLNFYSQTQDYTKWSSPDETANYFFTKQLSQTGQLSYFDAANIIGDNMVIPRSVRSDNGWVKPVSFLGIILIYGSLASIVGTAVIPFLTPWFAAWGIIFFYLIVRRLFSERVGLWSAWLLAIFPVYIYYTVRSMFHNVLFIVLLLISVYLFGLAIGRQETKVKTNFLTWTRPIHQWLEFLAVFGSGIFCGLAVITRTSELLWLVPVVLLVWIFYFRRLGFVKPFLFISGFVLALIPVAYYNQIIYNSFWQGGYNEMNRSLKDIAASGSEIWKFTWTGQFNYYHHYFGQIFNRIFYFGFDYNQSLVMLGHYVYEMFPFLLIGGILGLLIIIGQNFRRFQKKYLVYILGWLILSVILVFYYGSWKFNDNPDLTQFTIGNSYTRYWLPLYLGLMPLVSLALVRLSRALLFINSKTSAGIRRIIASGLQVLVILTLSIWSLMFVIYGSTEGLAYLYYNNQAEKVNAEKVWSLTEPTSVIITRYYDKFFWPERRVIMGTLPNDEILTAAAKLVKVYPVYYYNFYLDSAAVTYLNERKFLPYGLQMNLVKKLNAKFGLYKLTAKQIDYENTVKN